MIGNFPVISVAMPSYQQEGFLRKSISSVLYQAGEMFVDLVIVDGASTDGTVGLIKELAGQFNSGALNSTVYGGVAFIKSVFPVPTQCLGVGFRWVSESNSGQAEAINKGARLAVGEYLGWLNPGDRLLPDSLWTIVESLRDYRRKVVFGWSFAEDTGGKKLWRQQPVKADLRSLLLRKEGLPQPAVYFRRDVFQEGGGLREDLRYYLDHELWIRFAHKGVKFDALNKFLSIQMYHQNRKIGESKELSGDFPTEEARIRRMYLSIRSYRIFSARLQDAFASSFQAVFARSRLIHGIRSRAGH